MEWFSSKDPDRHRHHNRKKPLRAEARKSNAPFLCFIFEKTAHHCCPVLCKSETGFCFVAFVIAYAADIEIEKASPLISTTETPVDQPASCGTLASVVTSSKAQIAFVQIKLVPC
jgi:hypothetical protein